MTLLWLYISEKNEIVRLDWDEGQSPKGYHKFPLFHTFSPNVGSAYYNREFHGNQVLMSYKYRSRQNVYIWIPIYTGLYV